MSTTSADVLWFVGIVLLLNAVALTFLAIRMRAPIVVNVASPTALLPESVQLTLDALNEKLKPAKVSPRDDQLSSLVYEGVALAETSKSKGVDRFKIAKDFVLSRCTTLNYDFGERDIALRIEAAVAVNKKAR